MRFNCSTAYNLKYFSCLLLFSTCHFQDHKKDEISNGLDSLSYVNRDYQFKTISAKDSAQKAYRLDTLFKRIAAAHQINGNILVAQGRQILYQTSIGYANADLKTTLNKNSLFQLASVSKTLTAVLILKLQSQNKLNVKDKVQQYIKDWPYPEMTIHHLMCHRSGLKNYTYMIGDSLMANNRRFSNKAVLDFFIQNKPELEFETNGRFNYCNTNYVVLVSIAEAATHQSFYTLLKTKVLIPAGMKHTYVLDSIPEAEQKNLTRGHYHNFELLADDHFENVLGDKGIYSTTGDLFLMSKALFRNVLLNKSLTYLAYTSFSPERKYSTYGYGWRMFSDSRKMDKKYVYHNGWWHGYRNAFHRRLDDEVTIIVLSNRLNRMVYNIKPIFNAIDGIVPSKKDLEEEEKE
jgi:CubicO group peptidase (beta-lactamase class C family)